MFDKGNDRHHKAPLATPRRSTGGALARPGQRPQAGPRQGTLLSIRWFLWAQLPRVRQIARALIEGTTGTDSSACGMRFMGTPARRVGRILNWDSRRSLARLCRGLCFSEDEWAVYGMTGSITEDCCPILFAASSRKGWERKRLVVGLASHPSRGEAARRMGQRQVRLSQRVDMKLGLFGDFHFSNALITPVDPGLDVMNASFGVSYHLGRPLAR